MGGKCFLYRSYNYGTPRPGVYYGWLIVVTTFWMAMLTGGGRSGFGVFVIPMSEELGWNRLDLSRWQPLSVRSSVASASPLWGVCTTGWRAPAHPGLRPWWSRA